MSYSLLFSETRARMPPLLFFDLGASSGIWHSVGPGPDGNTDNCQFGRKIGQWMMRTEGAEFNGIYVPHRKLTNVSFG